jgi:hypothetical protein
MSGFEEKIPEGSLVQILVFHEEEPASLAEQAPYSFRVPHRAWQLASS